MGDEQKNKSIFDIINQYPVLKKYAKRGGIGLLLSALISLAYKFIVETNFNEIIEWLEKLISLILSISSAITIPLVSVILIFIYFYKKINDKGKFKQKFLKDTKEMIENDPTISNITIQEDNKNESLSIKIQRNDKRSLNAKTNNSIIDFQHYNSEVK